MAKRDKLLQRLLSKPKDFKYSEAKTLLEAFGYLEYNKGKTSGSRVIFYRERDNRTTRLHRPHPDDILQTYALAQIIEFLKEGGEIDE